MGPGAAVAGSFLLLFLCLLLMGAVLLAASLLRVKPLGIAADTALLLPMIPWICPSSNETEISRRIWAVPMDRLTFSILAAINRQASKERLNTCMEQLGLGNAKDKRVSKYSMGMRQRLGVAQAVMENLH